MLPTTALLVICRTFLGQWAVFAAGVVCALPVAGGTLATRPAVRDSGPATRTG
ncbi:hypothetical protein [Streptomyces sp. NPDC092370]|uniref:hypothetical protein n=1 Tax=Streptomyces sp. NPDC092370 TaxID=3366016 RepID=UPI0038305845